MKSSVKRHWSNVKCLPKGFSLLELLIVIAIITIISSAGAGFYRGFSKDVELSSTAQVIAADLRQMQAKSMAGESALKWGVHFVNGNTDPHYYETFSTPTDYNSASKDVTATTTLAKAVTFSEPTIGAITKDIIFSKISGTTTATTIVIGSEGKSQTVTISSIGTIY